MIALFIDGPLAGEVKDIPWPMPTYRVPLPSRVTMCDCDPVGLPEEVSVKQASVFEYHCIANGPNVALYTESDDDMDLVHSLKEWRISDFSVPQWVLNCRDRRAFK